MELNAVRARAIAAWEELYSVAEAAIGIARMPSVAALQRWLRDAQRWSTEELRAWQGERLCGVLAAHGVAEVRNADAAFGALRTLPPRDLMPVERWATTSTGPMRTTQLAVQIGSLLDWYHLRRGERWAFLGAPPFRGNGIRTTMAVERIARRDRSLAGYELDPLTSRRRLRAASSGRYGLWFGDASTLRAMADAAVGFGLPPAGPKLVVSTGEALAPSERTHLASVFGCVVLDQFTWRGVPLAISCRAGRYHVVDPFSIVEVLDGTKPCEDEASGELVVTRLDERGPAMLRVRTGDRAIAAGDGCPCGRPGPTL
ncbi:MAG TPA: hypothetical protein VF183_03870, partial [Acidimicrobiales bacterium]